MRWLQNVLKLGVAMVLLCAPAVASAQGNEIRIVAVVNEQPISSLDVDARMKLAQANAGMQMTPEIEEKLRSQLIKTMIDERLQVQEATRQGMVVSADELDKALENINAQRAAPPGTFEAFLRDRGVPLDVVKDQLRAQIGWTKLVYQKLRGKVRISDDEVARERERLSSGQEINEYQISSIVLEVSKPEDDAETRALAVKLATESKNGSDFRSMARQFSAGSADTVDQNQFRWVQLHQLEQVLAKQILAMRPGDVSQPVRTLAGYQILKLHDRRNANTAEVFDSEVLLKNIVMKLKPDAPTKEAEVLIDIAREIGKHPGSCDNEEVAGASGMEELNFETSFQRVKFKSMQPQLQAMLASLRVGDVTEPFATPGGIHLVMLCERIEMPRELPPVDAVKEKIFQDKLALEADKMLRDLRREAFIEVRSGS